MSQRQEQALKAAYAVGAARRAAKMAWMKVVRKLDKPSAERANHAQVPNAPSVAAGTAMKALVQALKATEQQQASQNQGNAELLQQASSYDTSAPKPGSEASLRLPADHQWDKWANMPSRLGGPRPAEGDAVVPIKPIEAHAPPPVELGMTLPPKITNGEASKDANKILLAVEQAAQKEKAKAANAVMEVQQKEAGMVNTVKHIALERLQREKDLQEENVKIQQENLQRAQQRAAAAEGRAAKAEQEEEAEGAQEAQVALDMVKSQQEHVNKDADAKVEKAKEEMADLLNGKPSRSMEYDAELFKPQIQVMPDSAYKKMLADKKAAADKLAAASKAKEMALLVSQQAKAKSEADKTAAENAAAVAKAAKVQKAMEAVDQAKLALSAAVASAPKDQGLDRYLSVPATADADVPVTTGGAN